MAISNVKQPNAKRKPRTKTSQRKPGGQPGNKNAEKHGFYSRQYSAEEASRLQGTDRASLDDEIDLMRVCMDRLAWELDLDAAYLPNKDGGQSNLRDDHYLKQINTMSLISQSIATLIRTQHLTRGKGGQVEQTILEALAELALEMKL